MDPVIQFVEVLLIVADRPYAFWGNGIQINDIHAEYDRLKREMEEYKNRYNDRDQKQNQKASMIPEIKIPKIQMSSVPLSGRSISVGNGRGYRKEEHCSNNKRKHDQR